MWRPARWDGPGRLLPRASPLRGRGAQPGLITAPPPPPAPRAGGLGGGGEGRVIINPRPEIPPEGPGWDPGRPPAPALLLLRARPPHHGNWAASRPPRSAPHSCLGGRAELESWAAPSGSRRGAPPVPRSWGPAPPPPPDGAHLLRGVREAGGTRDTPLDSLSSESRLSPTASTPAPGSFSLGARGVAGLRPVWCARPQRWVFASYEADTVEPIFQVKALRIVEGKARGWEEQEPGRVLRAAPRTARGSSGLSDTPASPLPGACNEEL